MAKLTTYTDNDGSVITSIEPSDGDIRIHNFQLERYEYGIWQTFQLSFLMGDSMLTEIHNRLDTIENDQRFMRDLELEREHEELRDAANYYMHVRDKLKTFKKLSED